jgi:ABC-2 type transport system permease protein
LTVNAEKGSAAGIVQSYAMRIVAAFEAERGGRPRIDVRMQTLFNPTLNYHHYMVPGILVALVTIIGTVLTAQNIAREKELGTLEQLNVTPITRGQFIVAKLLPFWVLALLDLGIGLIVARLVFDVPVRGSVLLLFASAALYMIAALAIGLWVSTVVETQQQAMFVTFFIINIYLLMSGLFTPVDSMAEWVKPLAELNPVRHFVTISRAVLIKGAGVQEIVTLGLAVRQYSKRLA